MKYEFEAIGTHWIVEIFDLSKTIENEDLIKKIQSRIEEFDLAYSRFRPDSLITKMSKSPGNYKLPEDSKRLLAGYEKFYRTTNGAVTPLIGNVLEQAGYDAEYSLIAKKLTSPLTWDEVLDFYFPNLEIKVPVILDFGAAGKGYLVDLIGELLESLKINHFCIDAGGDILYKNSDLKAKPLQIGLENPNNTEEAIGIANIKNQSLCGSSGHRRKWEGFNHIIDPHSLKSPENILATWVVANTGLMADGLATCLYFAEIEKLKSHFDFEYLIIYKDLSVEQSSKFPAELFLK